ncbi:MAG: DUF2244 domain-containing protein [Pseudomonadota bacterium]|nr:DUF2244 domain-containing protein [Pseudomonadota bacterium]
MDPREWILRRNCSITPRQLAGFYASLCGVSLLLAGIFTWQGAWLVLVFAVLELCVVGFALLHYARHATDREHLALIDQCLHVALIESERCREYHFDTRRLRIEVRPERHGLISLSADGTHLEVGRFLTQFKRRQFAQELRRALAVPSMTAWQETASAAEIS